ncbi:hypothetical protein [Paraburkholderia ferrariae]|uniref:hypothetical protein n=1 Tax=Paraburkholderia ferrariae TaxID=386056 RepID=UPI0005A914A9|nr:hypothetical protein [Paraburkholderia ferrariae]
MMEKNVEGMQSERDLAVPSLEGLLVELTVCELLLGFAGLTQKNRGIFLSSLNEFLVCSPQRRRRFIAEWGGLDESAEKVSFKR